MASVVPEMNRLNCGNLAELTALEHQTIFEVSILKKTLISKKNHYPPACTFDYGHLKELSH